MYMVGSISNQANTNSISFAVQSLYVSVITIQGKNCSYTKPKKSEYQGNNFQNVTSVKTQDLQK